MKESVFDRRPIQVAGVSAAAVAAGLAMSGPAQAIDFNFGEVEGFLDTQLTAGAAIRVAPRDCRKLGGANGGCEVFDVLGRRDDGNLNGDDGNLNYDQWEVFSQTTKITSEVQLNWRNWTAFVRGTAFYDPIVDTVEQDHRPHTTGVKSLSGHDVQLLDAFVTANFDIAGKPLDVRVGKQVISWGESTFIQNGINVINPIQVAQLRKPGSQIKDFIVPVWAAYASLGLADGLSIEGFFQFKWEEIVLDPSGTYFSTSDNLGIGGRPIVASTFQGQIPGAGAQGHPDQSGSTLAPLYTTAGGPNGNLSPKANNNEPSDFGDWGVALRYYAPDINQGTEFGLFFINYASRLPIFNLAAPAFSTGGAIFSPGNQGGATTFGRTPLDVTNAYNAADSFCQLFGLPAGAALSGAGRSGCSTAVAAVTGVALEDVIAGTYFNNTRFRIDYPEDIKLLGASFSTAYGGIAFQGDITYRMDQPFISSIVQQINSYYDATGFTSFATADGVNAANPTPNLRGVATADTSQVQGVKPLSSTSGGVADPANTIPLGFNSGVPGTNAGTTTPIPGGGFVNSGGVPVPQAAGFTNPGQISRAATVDLYNGPGQFSKIQTFDVITAQMTMTNVLFASHPVVWFAGADQGIALLEVGMVMVPSMSREKGILGTGGGGQMFEDVANRFFVGGRSGLVDDGLGTKFSWGMTGLANLTYNRAFGTSVNLVPSMSFSWGVNGNTPSPFGNFTEDLKSVTLALDANYQSTWSARIDYTNQFGPRAGFSDRDFASVSVSYSF